MTNNKNSIEIKFFALIREQIGEPSTELDFIENETMEALKQRVMQNGEHYKLALSAPLVMACNQTIVGPEHRVQLGDEIAFFPPVTGG